MSTIDQGVSGVAPKKKSSIIKWALIIGIAIVVNLFLVYLVDAIYNEPLYTDFCPERQVNRAIESEAACLEVGGQWNENVVKEKVSIPEQQYMPVPPGYCNENYTCGKQYEDVLKVYNRNVFVVFIVAGILLLIGSAYLGGTETVALGLAFGGVIALIIGSARYWSDMNDILRVVILGVALVCLIYVAWKKFQD
jgi:small-conductance mechanosensitive channel